MLLVVVYHYSHPSGQYKYPGIHPVPPEMLDEQLDEIGRHFEFIDGPQLLKAIKGAAPLPHRACLVTFDDGLKDHFQYVPAVLEKKGIRGVFFVPTQPLLSGKALDVHKLHWLRATRPQGDFIRSLETIAERFSIPLELKPHDEMNAARQYLYDEPAVQKIKYLLNHVLSSTDSARLVDTLFQEEVDEEAFCRDFYMNRNEIAELAQVHMIGSHACSHVPLTTLSGPVLNDELTYSKANLKALLGDSQEIEMISYPYGGPTTISPPVLGQVRKAGYVAGFTTEPSLNMSLNEPLVLARVDTYDAIGGVSPRLEMKNGQIEATPPLTLHRTIHFNEQALNL